MDPSRLRFLYIAIGNLIQYGGLTIASEKVTVWFLVVISFEIHYFSISETGIHWGISPGGRVGRPVQVQYSRS